MCENCYVEYGSPKIINENTIKASELIAKIYDCEMGGAGGFAHTVVDDWNLGDSNIDFCLNDAKTNVDADYPEETLNACVECLEFLKNLSLEERASALAIYDKFIGIN